MSTRHSGSRRARFSCTECGQADDAILGTRRHADLKCRGCFGKRSDRRPRDLNDLSGAEWARSSRSVEHYPDVRSDKQRFHGASFPQSLAEEQIRIYTKPGALVLDPFVGVGTTLDACISTGRAGLGVEINSEFADIARADLLATSDSPQTVVTGDARQLTQWVEPSSIDFIVTSPPYGSLLRSVNGSFAHKWKEHSQVDEVSNPRPYSNLPSDLGNWPYSGFLDALGDVLDQCFRVSKPGAYGAWVVKDFRTLKEGVPYVCFHADFIARATAAGFLLWDIRIFDQTKYRPLVCLGFPSKNFYLNIGHSYIVIIRRPF